MLKKTAKSKSKPVAKSFTFKKTIAVSPAEAFRMFTHATAWRDWFSNTAQVDARAGGLIFLGWSSGHSVGAQIKTFEPGKKLVLVWAAQGESQPTQVTVTFKARGSGTVVTVSHAGLGLGSKWAAARQDVQHAWPDGLENLKSVAETGIDLRVTRRPRLGIFIGDFNTDIAKQLGVPMTKGIHLEGTAEGTGARAAGLQKGDVLVKLGGKPAVDFATLGAALEDRKAGDKVALVWYRGNKKMTGPLTLGSFPISVVPDNAADLAMQMRKQYFDINTGFPKMLEGVSEVETSLHAGKEWSVRDLIAHFILTERDYQSWVADMINDRPVEDDLQFRPNVTPRIVALVERHKTSKDLLLELKRATDETLALLENLPPDLVARKHLYRRVATWALDVVPSHFHAEHAEQIKTAILAAKKK
jgi:uncharacterized protein YndB with AHSA1/START domain